MSDKNTSTLDQADALALRASLSTRAECLRARLHASQGIAVAPVVLSVDGDLLADIAALEIQVKELEAKLPNDAPAASNLSPAAKSPPVTTTPTTESENVMTSNQAREKFIHDKAAKKAEKDENSKLTLTERIMAAKGVTKLADLPPMKTRCDD